MCLGENRETGTRRFAAEHVHSGQRCRRDTPGFVAADATNLIVAANETHGANPSESGIAVYALDPRCRDETPLEACSGVSGRLDLPKS